MSSTAKLSLSERISWVKIHRHLTANDWSRKAGFRHNYLSVTVKRCEEEGRDLPARAASKLARVARVSEEWLRTGRGKPERTRENSNTSDESEETADVDDTAAPDSRGVTIDAPPVPGEVPFSLLQEPHVAPLLRAYKHEECDPDDLLAALTSARGLSLDDSAARRWMAAVRAIRARSETATVGTVALELARTAHTAQGATTATDKVGGGSGSGAGSKK